MKKKTQNNKVAIVTGGTSGIGFAIARKFIEHGILTIVTGRNEQRLQKTKSTLGKLCVALPMDMNDLREIPAHIQKLTKQYGTIDILVNNAGINFKKEMTGVTDSEFEQVLLTNVTGVFVISREVSKTMIRKKKGHIINISSMAAHYGLPKVIAYSASKAAVEGMTRAMAVELSPHGVLVNCIAPGFIKTSMSSSALDGDPERKQRVLKRTPMGKLGLPEDVAGTAYFLVSDENAFITGAVIPVDGGNSIGF